MSGLTVERIDDRFDYGETRLIATGEIGGREFVCVYTRRGEVFRPISLRRAKRRERDVYSKRKPAAARHRPDWEKLEALTDEEIDAQIAANPDAAPALDWSLDDPLVVMMEPVDVKAIRAKLGMGQQEFARTFGITLAELRDWEQQRRAPRGPARTLLRIIDREPDAVRRALASEPAG